MKPQDHSDTTLLVWADWLEENGEEQKAHELREEIANPPANRWHYAFYKGGGRRVGGYDGGSIVGGIVGGITRVVGGSGGINVTDGRGIRVGGGEGGVGNRVGGGG